MDSEFAPAKVNLFLHVLGRRPDGYHDLDSLAVFADVGDTLHATPADALTLEITGPFAAGLRAEADNLVLRAARRLADAAGLRVGAQLVLDKVLPVASGLGGGSADAAAALRLLNRVWGLHWPLDRLRPIAATLGADVPVCLMGTPARMGGIGDDLRPAPALPGCGMVLINPGVAVSTASVFRAMAGGRSEPAVLPDRWDSVPAMIESLEACRNDLQRPACEICPEINAVLETLWQAPGCQFARMSGSGATCFGLFATKDEAALNYSRFNDQFTWVCIAVL